ncbi:hypothetical protein Glove_134g204 [Diversispora epigaea]|uniref:Uncharacterized protein n=1 Tax=Diversispora epigaea TaxID=1348612 RepID=A0A397J752_9GLOM|nr:hypothetical protein Glove_134g204 [Diversispora epigaea]
MVRTDCLESWQKNCTFLTSEKREDLTITHHSINRKARDQATNLYNNAERLSIQRSYGNRSVESFDIFWRLVYTKEDASSTTPLGASEEWFTLTIDHIRVLISFIPNPRI